MSAVSTPSASSSAAGPDVFFEVSRPIGGFSSPCSALILQHAFAYTYDLPPAVANYTPPSHCSKPWDQIVLKWSGTCKGRQYDRIAAVWFGGVEVLRTCTAEPTSSGIYWEVRKDVTRFASVFKEPQLVVLELANVVDSTYTGIFNINLTLEFYKSRHRELQDADQRLMSHHDARILHTGVGGSHESKHFDALIQADQLFDRKHSDTPLHTDAGYAAEIDVNKFLKHDLERDRTMRSYDGGLQTIYSHGPRVSSGDALIDRNSSAFHSDAGFTAAIDVDMMVLEHEPKRDHMMDVHEGGLQTIVSHYVQWELSSISDDGLHGSAATDVLPSVEFPVISPADLIIPISQEDGFSGGHWFEIATENDTVSASFSPPKNILRAVLEICVSFHGTDEFWYTNPPNDYLEANGLSGYPGNGPFREVQVFLDDVLVGAVWPFPVIFTGGINPLYWRPAAAIGAYNLPSYDIELTPFVGSLVDGSNHTISMSVTNADGSWPVDANLHLWLDPYTSQTMGGLLTHDAPTAISSATSDFEGLDGTFHTSAGRTIAFSGYTVSSLGTILTSVSYTYSFNNVLIFQNSSSVQTITQETQTKGEVTARTPSKVVFSQEITRVYPFYLSSADYSGANSVYTEECNLTHSFNQDTFTVSSSTSAFESLKNSQAAAGSMTVVGSSVTAGVGALQQHYDFQSTEGCYDRFLATKNYSTMYDITVTTCQSDRADS